jgi:hypothetical protein
MAVSAGAILLAWVLWQEDRAEASASAVAGAAVPISAPGGEPGEIV